MAGCANSRHPYTDQLGSVSVATAANGALVAQQEYDPWGKVRPYAVPRATITQTKRNYTGQILDSTGLLFYNARYYDPAIGRFISADTVVPGNASEGMEGVAVKPLTVGFHENQFLGKVNQENGPGSSHLNLIDW
jgi:RHS repeat-associated protein